MPGNPKTLPVAEGSGSTIDGHELDALYARRFSKITAYRTALWNVLITDFFQSLVPSGARLLDLGCGYAQFVNGIEAMTKYAMDLNPQSKVLANADVTFFLRDCSEEWPLEDSSLDFVFTSNFLEHLSDKPALQRTMHQAARCLAPGGKLVCLGPNFRFVSKEYWDFWDHHIALSERTLVELLGLSGFEIERIIPQFLPYTMADGGTPPLFLVRAYLRMPFAWPLFGKQFLVVAKKPN